jgi:hypothetical protein
MCSIETPPNTQADSPPDPRRVLRDRLFAASRGKVTGVGMHPFAERAQDLYETPAEAVHGLLEVESFTGPIWECAAGRGAIVRALRATGATFAVIEAQGVEAFIAVLVECIDIPVIGSGANERVDVAAIRNFIEEHKPARAVVERAGAMPKQGVSSTFKYGRATGAIEAAITLCSIPVEIIEASAWKRFWHLPGKGKESAAHAALARKRDHGRAEATLIALYGARR